MSLLKVRTSSITSAVRVSRSVKSQVSSLRLATNSVKAFTTKA